MSVSETGLSADTRFIELQHGYRTLIDEADWPLVAHLKPYRSDRGYAVYMYMENGQRRCGLLHRLLLGLEDPKVWVDHINCNRLDNRRANLRIASPLLNVINRRELNRNNSSGARGVRFSPQCSDRPWHARIGINRRTINLGYFATRDEAVAARRAAELEHYGEVCP